MLVASVGLAAAHDNWGEKCPDPLHLEESDNATFDKYDQNTDGKVSLEEVIAVYTNGVDDQEPEETAFHAKKAWKQLDVNDDGEVTKEEFYTAGMTQTCVGPKLADSGGCPSPFIMDGESEFFKLSSEHYELRKLSWSNMSGMKKDELRKFMRVQDVPFTVRTKVLNLHDTNGGVQSKECVPVPPMCHGSLEYNEDGTCRPPSAHYENPVINDAWVQPTLVVDGSHHDEKAPRVHQAVENDPNDNLMIKERHTEENNLWNWEKVRKHTAH